jgi:prephenate dehydrogenase
MALDRVSGWWRALGARVQAMPPARHDEILAVTSHLPHLLAFAYLGGVADEHLEHAAGGFRDFTRIGAADAQMWASIFTLNQSAVLAALDDFEGQLARLRTLVEAGDLEALEPLLEAAAARRRSFPHDG